MSGIRSGPRNFFRLSIINFLLKPCVSGGVVFDAGCGDGTLSIRLAKRGFEVYSMDCSREWCEILLKRKNFRNLKGKIKVFCSSIEKAEFEPGFFDAVICGDVLEHVEDDSGTLKNFYSMLKYNGIAVISVPLKNKGEDSADSMVGHVRLYAIEELFSLLRSAGFQVEKYFIWGVPFARLYHKFIFLKWASKFKSEDEIKKPSHFITRVGKNRIVSFMIGILFFIDIFFTRPRNAEGIAVRVRKV